VEKPGSNSIKMEGSAMTDKSSKLQNPVILDEKRKNALRGRRKRNFDSWSWRQKGNLREERLRVDPDHAVGEHRGGERRGYTGNEEAEHPDGLSSVTQARRGGGAWA